MAKGIRTPRATTRETLAKNMTTTTRSRPTSANSVTSSASATATATSIGSGSGGGIKGRKQTSTTPMNNVDTSVTNTKHVMLPAFLSKTFEIFSMPEFSYICGWNANGDTIIVSHLESFVANVLPRFFKHRNFPSFVRQLNLYGFHKTVLDSKRLEFQHPYFKRDRPDLLHYIKRKVSSSSTSSSSSSSINHPTNNTTSTQNTSNNQLALAQQQQRLEAHREISDTILKELKDLRQRSETLEKRLREVEIDNAIVRSDNLKLWKHLESAKDKQLIMQEKMKKIMWILFQIYRGGKQKIPKLSNHLGASLGASLETGTHLDAPSNININTDSGGCTINGEINHEEAATFSDDYINSSNILGPKEFRDVLRYLAMDEPAPPLLSSSSSSETTRRRRTTSTTGGKKKKKRKFVEVPADEEDNSSNIHSSSSSSPFLPTDTTGTPLQDGVFGDDLEPLEPCSSLVEVTSPIEEDPLVIDSLLPETTTSSTTAVVPSNVLSIFSPSLDLGGRYSSSSSGSISTMAPVSGGRRLLQRRTSPLKLEASSDSNLQLTAVPVPVPVTTTPSSPMKKQKFEEVLPETTTTTSLIEEEEELPLLNDDEHLPPFGEGEEQVMKKLEDFETSLLDEYDVSCLDTLLQQLKNNGGVINTGSSSTDITTGSGEKSTTGSTGIPVVLMEEEPTVLPKEPTSMDEFFPEETTSA